MILSPDSSDDVTTHDETEYLVATKIVRDENEKIQFENEKKIGNFGTKYLILIMNFQEQKLKNGFREKKYKQYEEMIYEINLTFDETLQILDIKKQESNLCQ